MVELVTIDTLTGDAEKASLWEVCEWWIETYPEAVFVNEPEEIVVIRFLMKKILEKRMP